MITKRARQLFPARVLLAPVLFAALLLGFMSLSTSQATTADGSPDLTVSSTNLSFTGTNLLPGSTTTLKAQVSNTGTVTATNVVVRFLVDGKQVYEKKLSSLSKNGKSTVSYSYKIPLTAGGPFTFSAVLDPANTVAESNELNNTAQIEVPVTPATRNLIIESFKPNKTNPKPAETITWQVKVKNGGNIKAENVKLVLYADPKSAEATATLTIASLNAGSSTTKTFSRSTPGHPEPATGYLVRVAVDPDNTLAETNELDNVASYSLSFTVPDVSIAPGAEWLATSHIYPGQFSQITVKVTNDNVVDLTNVKVGVYGTLGTASATRTKLGETTLTLKKKATVEYMFDRVPLPAGATIGTLNYVFLVVDPDNAIAESNEKNNEISLQRSIVQRPLTAQCPCVNVTVHDEDGNPTNATVKLHIATPAGDFTKVAGSDALNNNASGYVTFDGLPATAQLTLTVSQTGYRTQTDSFAYDRTDEETVHRAYNLDKRAVLTGTVKNQAGEPLASVSVIVAGTDLETTTDAGGRYGFMLNGGAYSLRFVKAGFARIVDQNIQVAPLATVMRDKTMSTTTVAYVSGTVTDDDGNGLANTDIYINGSMVGTTGNAGQFAYNSVSAGQQSFKFRHPGYVDTEFSEMIEAGQEYRLSFTMYKPSTEGHAERGTEIVSWHQHEGTPANAFFVNEYNVDVWWGIGRVKMALDYTRNGSDASLAKLTITNTGLDWECNKVESEGSIETSAIDIPVTIAAGSCTTKQTQMDVYKVAIESGGQEVWSNTSFWTTASYPQNAIQKVFTLDSQSVTWDGAFKVKMWVRVQQRAVVGTDGDGAGALVGYHLDKKLITWYPQRPPTTVISTSWKQVGGYLLGILDNPVNAVTGFTDIFTVERFNQYSMEEVLPAQFPGAPP